MAEFAKAAQLVLPFSVEPGHSREEFIVAPCNVQAWEFISRSEIWPARAAALHGPAGCGKSHLASIWQSQAKAHRSAASELSLGRPEAGISVVIEDVDRSEPSLARDHALMALFERPSGVLLFTGRTAPPQWPVLIADLASRFLALLAFPLWAPDDALLSALIVKHFADRQLGVPDSVVHRIMSTVERTPQAIAAFVRWADEMAFAEKRAVTERLILQLLDRGPVPAESA